MFPKLIKSLKIYPQYFLQLKGKRLQAFTKTYHILTAFLSAKAILDIRIKVVRFFLLAIRIY